MGICRHVCISASKEPERYVKGTHGVDEASISARYWSSAQAILTCTSTNSEVIGSRMVGFLPDHALLEGNMLDGAIFFNEALSEDDHVAYHHKHHNLANGDSDDIDSEEGTLFLRVKEVVG